jgi:CHASE2 domain-containing sensor protein
MPLQLAEERQVSSERCRRAHAQGIYYLITGLWPLVSIGTFQRVTSPKTDLWLVNTVGVLIAVIGAALLLAGMRGDVTPSVIFLAVASAAGLAGVDVIYVSKQVIARIYLLDALVELALLVWWLIDVATS